MIRTILMVATLTISATFLAVARGSEAEGTVSVAQAVPPVYPAIARAALVRGEVLLEATVDLQGAVVAVNVIKGHKLLNAAAERAASKWKFNPLGHGAQKRKIILSFQFTLITANKATSDDLGVIFWPPYKVEVRDAPNRIY